MAQQGTYNSRMPPILGSQRFLEHHKLSGPRVGLVSNPASVDSEFRHFSELIAGTPDMDLVALFGPQHGFHADVQDNMVETAHSHHSRFGVPVYSLYSNHREPTSEMLDGIDVLVIDLQDVGTRVYTYIYTMANCLRAAAKHGVPVVVCDRPNPIGATALEGPVLDIGLRSFVGQFPIPLRHGMTIAELALLFNDHYQIGAELEVVTMSGWTREQYLDETGMSWVVPSPNLPTLDSAIVYPGTVLLEGTNLSEGRGTTRPFELFGAPGLDPDNIASELNNHNLPGVHFRPTTFEPTFQKHAGSTCGGCHIHVTDRSRFKPVTCGVAIILACRQASPANFEWRQPPYEYEEVQMPIDILAGTKQLRYAVDNDYTLNDIKDRWESELNAFLKIRQHFLLY